MKCYFLSSLLVFLSITGCATTQIEVADSTSPGSSEPAAAAKKSPSPNVELTSDILYDLLLADVAARRGHMDVSVSLFQKLAETTRDPRLAERATRVAVYARRNTIALETAKLWLELAPDDGEARQLVTALYLRNGQSDEALAHMEEILARSESRSENGFLFIAGLLSREKDKRAALGIMEQLVARYQDNPDALFAYSHLAMRLGELAEATEAIDKTLVIRPDWVPAVLQKARLMNAQDKTSQTLGYLKEAVDKTPDEIDYRLFYARLLADEDRLAEAFDQFKVIADLSPENEDALFALGFIALQLDRLDEAEKYLTRLKDTGGRGFEVNYYLGRLEEARNNDEEAKSWYGSIVQGEHYMNAQIRIIVITAKNDDLVGARAHIEALKAQRPTQKLRLTLVEGEILTDNDEYEAAMEVYNQALGEFPDNTDLLYARSMVAEKLDQLELMEADLTKILARDPNNAEALNALGYTLADRTERYDEALELIQRALELRPSDFYIVDSMGWVQYRLGNYEESVKYLRRALDIKMDVEVAAHLGEVLWVMGEKEEAREVWQSALESDPKAKSNVITEVVERLDR